MAICPCGRCCGRLTVSVLYLLLYDEPLRGLSLNDLVHEVGPIHEPLRRVPTRRCRTRGKAPACEPPRTTPSRSPPNRKAPHPAGVSRRSKIAKTRGRGRRDAANQRLYPPGPPSSSAHVDGRGEGQEVQGDPEGGAFRRLLSTVRGAARRNKPGGGQGGGPEEHPGGHRGVP